MIPPPTQATLGFLGSRTTVTRRSPDITAVLAPPPDFDHVRGDAFQPEHWRSLFNKLDIEKVKLADLCLSHFIGAAEAIVDNAEYLRELNARAHGEVAIREAITEVKQWSEEAVFSIA